MLNTHLCESSRSINKTFCYEKSEKSMVMKKTTNENLQCLFSANERVKTVNIEKVRKTMHLIAYPVYSFYRKIICPNLVCISKSSSIFGRLACRLLRIN